MESRLFPYKWCCIFFPFFLAANCSLNLEVKKPKGEEGFFREMSRLEKLAQDGASTSVRAESHLQLAFLYLDARNPRLNYSRALQEMEIYLSVRAPEQQEDNFRNWFAVLKALEDVRSDRKGMEGKNEGLQTQIGKLKIGLEKIQETNKTLRDEVTDLAMIIEEIKKLDCQIEEKRSYIK